MKRAARLLIIVLAVSATLVWIAVWQMPDGKLHIFFLDVESGQSILVRTPAGRWTLIDGGPQPSVTLAALGRFLPFWQRTLFAVIATHQGTSAMLPLIDVSGRYRILAAFGPPASDPTLTYREWRMALNTRNTPLHAQAQATVDLGDSIAIELAQSSAGRLTVRLTYGQVSVFLPGAPPGTGAQAEATVVAYPVTARTQPPPRLPSGVLALVLFSGRRTASPPDVPTVADVAVFSTAALGTIEMVSDGQNTDLRRVR
jgi:hypothetical protein